jgi:hypothetical protein
MTVHKNTHVFLISGSISKIIAFSTATGVRMPRSTSGLIGGCISADTVHNDAMTPLFQAVLEATEESLINSLFIATDTVSGSTVRRALPINDTLSILKKYGVIGNGKGENNDECEKTNGCSAMNIGFAALLVLSALALHMKKKNKQSN